MTRRILTRPHFGELPEKAPTHVPGIQPVFRYKRLLDGVRMHPGVPAKIAFFTGKTARSTLKPAMADKRAIQLWLDKNCPDEIWEVHTRRLKDTWADREVWVVFHGEDAQGAAQARAERRQWYETNLATTGVRRRNKFAASRLTALKDTEENHRAAALRRRVRDSEAGTG